MLATEVRSGDAPKPMFSMKNNEQFKKSGNQPQINHRNLSLFLSLGEGSDKFQPEMFDMDPFGGRNVPCTKYQQSGINNLVHVWPSVFNCLPTLAVI